MRLGCALAILLALSGCSRREPDAEAVEPVVPAGDIAASALAPPSVARSAPSPLSMPGALSVPIEPRSGSTLRGTAGFAETATGVRVVVQVENATPGQHGVHVHENGDCSAPDAKSAGDHYNPYDTPHGLPPAEPRHLGDLGNITVAPDGRGTLDVIREGARLGPTGKASFIGKALVVHADPDTGAQPAGDSGARVGCAVIQRPK